MKNTIAILTLLASLAATGFAPAKSPVIEPAPDVKLRVKTKRDSFFGKGKDITIYYGNGVLKGKKKKEERIYNDGELWSISETHYCGIPYKPWSVEVVFFKYRAIKEVEVKPFDKADDLPRHFFKYKTPLAEKERFVTDIPAGLLDGGYNLDSIKYNVTLAPNGQSFMFSLTNVSDKPIKINMAAFENARVTVGVPRLYTIWFGKGKKALHGHPTNSSVSRKDKRTGVEAKKAVVRVLAPQQTICQKITLAEFFAKDPENKKAFEWWVKEASEPSSQEAWDMVVDLEFKNLFLQPAWADEVRTSLYEIKLGDVNEIAKKNPRLLGNRKK